MVLFVGIWKKKRGNMQGPASRRSCPDDQLAAMLRNLIKKWYENIATAGGSFRIDARSIDPACFPGVRIAGDTWRWPPVLWKFDGGNRGRERIEDGAKVIRRGTCYFFWAVVTFAAVKSSELLSSFPAHYFKTSEEECDKYTCTFALQIKAPGNCSRISFNICIAF